MNALATPQTALLALAVVAALSLAPTAHAATTTDPVGAHMKAMDSNADKLVSRDEYAAAAKAKFDAMDSSHDSQVSAEEMDAANKAMQAKGEPTSTMASATVIKSMDLNTDGMISSSEHAQEASKRFGSMDGNHDGQLDEQEMRIGHDAGIDMMQ